MNIQPWAGAVGAIIVFFAGIAIGPFVKAREALFLEQRHNRRRFQELAEDVMVKLKERSRTFNTRGVQHFAHGVRHFGEDLRDHQYELSRTDRAACHWFDAAIWKIGKATDAEEYRHLLNNLYDHYLDVKHPVRRWRRRRAARLRFYKEITRADFTNFNAEDSASNDGS